MLGWVMAILILWQNKKRVTGESSPTGGINPKMTKRVMVLEKKGGMSNRKHIWNTRAPLMRLFRTHSWHSSLSSTLGEVLFYFCYIHWCIAVFPHTPKRGVVCQVKPNMLYWYFQIRICCYHATFLNGVGRVCCMWWRT